MTTAASAHAASVDGAGQILDFKWWLLGGFGLSLAILLVIAWRRRHWLAQDTGQIASLLRFADYLIWHARVERVHGEWEWTFSIQPTALSWRLYGDRPPTRGIWDPFSIPEWKEMCARSANALDTGQTTYHQQFHLEFEGKTIWLQEHVSLRPLGPHRFHVVGLVTDITKQQEAELARLTSEERLRQLLSRVDCMLWEARVSAQDNGEFHWEWFVPKSELYRRITGDTAYATRMPWSAATVPEYGELQSRSRRAMLQGLPAYEQEFRLVMNNSVRWMHEQVTVESVAPGQWRLRGVAIDITAQRQAEESKRASEAQLRQIMDTADFLLWHARVFISPAGHAQWVLNVPRSTLYRRLFGRDPEHPIALPWNELVDRETFEAMDRRSQAALRSGIDSYEQEFLARRGDQVFWLREQATIRSVAPGEWQLVGIVSDVSSRHRAEEERQATERAMKEILERVDCLLWRANVVRRGHQLEWLSFDVPESRLRNQLLSDTAVSGAGQLWSFANVPELPEMNLRSTQAILSGSSGYDQEFHAVRDSRVYWLHEQVTIIPTGPDEWQTLGVVTDVTQRHEAEEAQRRSEGRLEQLLERADCLIWQGRITEQDDGTYTWVIYVPRSRLYRRIFDRDPQGEGFAWKDIGVPEYQQMEATGGEALRANLSGYQQVFHVPKPAGDIWLAEQATLTRTGPRQWEAVGVITDITARREAEDARLATEAQLQSILELADCMVWQADVREDQRGVYQWTLYSPHSVLYERLFGKKHEQGRIGWNELNVPDQQEINARADRAIRDGAPRYEQEFRVLYPDRVIWLHEVVTITRASDRRFRLVGVITDVSVRREAQEAYRASVEQLEQMLGSADCLLWQARVFVVRERELRWLTFLPRSRLYRELFGADPDDRNRIPWDEIVDEVARTEMHQRATTAILAGEAGYEQEFRAQRHGRTFWLHEHVSITPAGANELKLVGVVTDLTARREAEQAVRASELRYRTLYQHTPVAIIEADFSLVGEWFDRLRAQGMKDLATLLRVEPHRAEEAARLIRVVDCNDTAVQMLRARSKRDFRKRRNALATPETEETMRLALLALWNGRNTLESAVRMRDFEGRLHELNLRWWVDLTDRGLNLRQLVLVLVDVTELKVAEAALAAEKERLAVTLRAMAEGVITTDVDGRVQYMNPAAVTFTDCPAAAAVGQLVGAVCTLENDRTGEKVEVPVARVARGDVVVELPAGTRLRAREGGTRLVEGCCAPIHSAASAVIGTVVVLRDVTEHERLEQELVRATKLESVGILAGGIAHDFNNILTAVMGNVALAALDVDPESDAGRSLREAEKATLRARDLTQQLLTFAKGGEPVRAAVQLDAIVREIVSFTLHGSKVRAEYDLPRDLWLADADRGQIGRVVQNLVLNAIQAMPEGGTVRISLRNDAVDGMSRLALAPGRYVQLAIADGGVGIKPEHLPRIFDPYFTTKQKGSGLGLAAVYSIVTKHRGAIDVQSQLGAGTTFRIWLPATDHGLAEPDSGSAPVERTLLRGRVLFMDDEEPIRQMAAFLLRRFGFEVVCVADGAEAIRKYREAAEAREPFALVIMDLTVPGGMGGREAITHLRGIDPGVRAIVSSGYSSDPILANFREHGFCGVVGKPYEVAELARVLRDTLAGGPARN